MELSSQSYGQTLPDQAERIAELIDVHLELTSDLREFYKDRLALEREYATKLQALVKKATDKKSKIETSLVLGKDPTKTWQPSDLQSSTLAAAYNELIASTISLAQDRASLADAFTAGVVEKLKNIEASNEDIKKKEMTFFQKLIGEKERRNNDRLKMKAKYDDECREVEAVRHKQSRSQDDRHADRVTKQAEQQRVEMLNCKNQYIISTAVANRVKNKLYGEDIPELEDAFQLQQTKLIRDLVDVLLSAQAMETNHLDISKNRLLAAEAVFQAVNPATDQEIFIDFNIRPFTIPLDWKFEPCQNFYDTAEINVEPAPKVVLQNSLRRCQAKLNELSPVLNNKRKEFDQLKALQNPKEASGDLVAKYVEARQQATEFSTSECILNAESETILSALGDDIGGQQPHTFKSTSFSIPTTCAYCQTSIWGLTKQGKTCKACGISVHGKCEMKIPADCQGSDRPSSLKPAATATKLDLSPPEISTPTPSSFVQPAAVEEPAYPTALVLFDFESSSEFELTVRAGSSVRVLEHDDGSGWVKVLGHEGEDGLVPASYLQYAEITTNMEVRALYDYAPSTSDELPLQQGDIIRLTEGPNGGKNYADGWWEGINGRGEQGIFPSNYVETV